MTESDYESVQTETPKIVAKRIGIGGDIANGDIGEAIRRKDQIAFVLMEEFRRIYREWWEVSNNVSSENHGELGRLRELITSRNEIRNSLMSYLNAKYGRLQ